MKRLWKKPAVKITAAAVVAVALALLGLWISSLRSVPAITFDFLNGRDLTRRIEREYDKLPVKIISQYYSFEADFNDVCEAADAELTALGFERDFSLIREPEMRMYRPAKGTYNDLQGVIIFDKYKITVYSTPESRQYSGPDRYKFEYSSGWVTVEIRHRRLRSWPPQHLLYRLKMHLQSASRKKS